MKPLRFIKIQGNSQEILYQPPPEKLILTKLPYLAKIIVYGATDSTGDEEKGINEQTCYLHFKNLPGLY